MFRIRRAEAGDVAAAVAALGEAFAPDPLMHYLFREYPEGPRTGAMGFFSILLRARVALGAPAYVLQQDGDVLGAVMGYDTSPPDWPASLTEEFKQFKASVPGFASRLETYGKLAETYEPQEPHYYLGVIGVHPSLQGKGAGKALLDAFCAPSLSDPKSRGVYLETSSRDSLRFYYANGFELRGEDTLDGTPLWCVFKRT